MYSAIQIQENSWPIEPQQLFNFFALASCLSRLQAQWQMLENELQEETTIMKSFALRKAIYEVLS